MKLGAFDYFLARMSSMGAPLFRELGDMETQWLGEEIKNTLIDRPIFVTGLARAGTTILLNLLSQIEGVATHQYRDFPFLFTPVMWNRMTNRFSKEGDWVERPHQDTIMINRKSPEAFEEPIWQHFFPHVHKQGSSHVLDQNIQNDDFEAFYRDHLKKILMLRGGSRYVAKANYNVARIQYLASLFPSARFVVVIRNPFDHVNSLVTQHEKFMAYAQKDARVGPYLKAVGHYEFGPQRVAVNYGDASWRGIENAWRQGKDGLGYAEQWSRTYAHVSALLELPSLAKNIHIIRHEDLCADAMQSIDKLMGFCELPVTDEQRARLATSIRKQEIEVDQMVDKMGETQWGAVSSVAKCFGYSE